MRTVEEIQKEIDAEKEKLPKITGTRCERYARIVGYYRPLDHWNPGKSEEFKHRKDFVVSQK